MTDGETKVYHRKGFRDTTATKEVKKFNKAMKDNDEKVEKAMKELKEKTEVNVSDMKEDMDLLKTEFGGMLKDWMQSVDDELKDSPVYNALNNIGNFLGVLKTEVQDIHTEINNIKANQEEIKKLIRKIKRKAD